MRTCGRLLLVAGLVLGGTLGVGAPALAHNSLTGSDPTDGDAVERAPDQIRLEFLAAVDPVNAEFDVTGPDGGSVLAGDPEVDEGTVLLPVEPGPAGDYQVAWRVLSSDGDWIDGTVDFEVTVGEPASPTPSPTRAAPPPAPATTSAPDPVPVARDEAGGGPAWWVWAVVTLAVVAVVGGYLGFRARRGTGQPG